MTAPLHTTTPLRELLGNHHYWRWSVSAQLTRLPVLMIPLAFVLVGTYSSGTYAVGGIMVTAYIITEVCCASIVGRLLDWIGLFPGISCLLGLAALSHFGLAISFTLKAPVPLLILLAVLVGTFTAGVPGTMRSLLSKAIPSRLLAPALAIDSTLVEVVVVIAPLLVSVTAIWSPVGALVAMASVTALAGLLVYGLRGIACAAPQADRRDLAVPKTFWHNSRFLFWVVVNMAFGHAIGTAETCALPLSNRLGGNAFGAALLLATLAVTSALSGVAYASFSHWIRIRTIYQACILLTLLTIGCLVLGLSTSWVTAISAMIILGICTAPLNTVQTQGAEAEIPAARKSEAFGILYSANGVGFALGGIFLALLPLSATLITGGASAIGALILTPLLLRRGQH